MKRLLLVLALLLCPVNAHAASIAGLLPNGEQQFIDGNGVPYAGGHVYFYVPLTTTPKNTWQDTGETILNTNPVTLDAAGRAIIYGQGQYRQILFDNLGNQIWDQLTSSSGVTQTNQAVVSTGSADAYVVTYAAAPTSYQIGGYYPFIANFTNTTTTPTENVNGLGPKTITKLGATALAAGDICNGQVIIPVYDGTRLQMTNPPCNATGGGTVTSVATNNGVTGGTITTSGTIGLAAVGSNNVLANTTGGSAAPTGTAITALTPLLSPFTNGAQGVVPASGGGTSNFLRADASWAAPNVGFTTCVQVVSATGSGAGSETATCSFGYTLTGGGCEVPGENYTGGYPSSNSFICSVAAGNGLVAHAVCCH